MKAWDPSPDDTASAAGGGDPAAPPAYAAGGAVGPPLWTPLEAVPFTVFDTETTGFSPAEDRIVAIGAVRLVSGRMVLPLFDSLINPCRHLPPEVAALTGIDEAALRRAPTAGQVLPVFLAFARGTVLVAHNAAFDRAFLARELWRTRRQRLRQLCLDTRQLAMALEPGRSADLDELARRHDVSLTGRHTALGDAVIAAKLLLRFLETCYGSGIRTLGDLYAWLNART
ncbi:MAG: 3'-5' exonuclease [Clostridia bacterium]|nr:3'-5' exonuclease [Clostridia bacterium]